MCSEISVPRHRCDVGSNSIPIRLIEAGLSVVEDEWSPVHPWTAAALVGIGFHQRKVTEKNINLPYPMHIELGWVKDGKTIHQSPFISNEGNSLKCALPNS